MYNRTAMFKIFIGLLCISGFVSGQTKPDSVWMNQKFSMFIHFGLYSELGGVWEGKPVTSGYSEQIQSHGGIFSDWYAEVANRFNPTAWNADSIVALAQAAGMKSIVFTSKHHDGFCMYHSKYTDFNIVDATPFGRDVMQELADACRKRNMRFGVYYSLIDWHFPQAYPISSHNADPLTPEHYDYNLKQVEEIMTGYGAISEIWFDMGSLTPEQSRGLYDLVSRLQPKCMISGRLGNDCSDFSVLGDNEYPDYKIGVPWQTAASFFDETWGYRSWQKRGEVRDKVNEKLLSLVRVVSHGGNYLLNIGPKGDGSVVPFEKEVLLKMGKWLDRYGEAIYGAEANPLDLSFDWGEITAKENRLYLFVSPETPARSLRLEGVKGKVSQVETLEGTPLSYVFKKGAWEIDYITAGRKPWEVIRVTFEKDFRIDPVRSRVRGKTLTPRNAEPLYAYSSIDYYTGFQSIIAYTWGFSAPRGNFEPWIDYTDQEKGKRIRLEIDDQQQVISLEGDEERKSALLGESDVYWGKVFLKRSGSVFGRRPQEIKDIHPEAPESEWREWAGFKRGKEVKLPVGERSSILLLQEIEAKKAGEVLVELTSGNGIQIILNGDYISVHTSPKGKCCNRERVVLPLKKGKNQLLLKLYNRFEKKLCLGVRPLPEGKIYRLKAGKFILRPADWHRCILRPAEPESRNSAIRLNNIRIGWK